MSSRSLRLTSSSGGLVLLCVAALGGASHRAAADDAADERKLAARSALTQAAFAVGAARAHGFFDSFVEPVATCRAAIQDGTAAGLRPMDTFDGVDGPVLWKHAAATCDEYGRLAPLRAAVDAIGPDHTTIMTIRNRGQGIDHMRGDAYRATVEVAQRCVKSVDAALAAGAPGDVKLAPGKNEHDTLITLAEVRAQCAEFVTWGAQAGAADDAAEAARVAALRAKYARLGITGDRLKYLMDSDTHLYVMGKGCKALDLAGKKSAPVIYEMQEGDTYWVVYKMTFKGDRLVKQSERRFDKATHRGWSCK